MKISDTESGRALAGSRALGAESARILPADRPKGLISGKKTRGEFASPLEKGMSVAEAALGAVPDVREDVVKEIKDRIEKGEYSVTGQEIADMMLRRLAADRIR